MPFRFKRHKLRTGLAAAAVCVAALAACPVFANPLQAFHELALKKARSDALAASTAQDRREAQALEVAALNSLGRSELALQRLDESESAMAGGKHDAELRAKVLLPLGRCDEAVPLLQADIAARDAAARSLYGPAYQPDGPLVTGAEPLLALMYCHAANRRFDAATAALSRVFDPMDPSLMHYTAAWYSALRKLGAAENGKLEASGKSLPATGGIHAISLAVVQRRMPLEQAQRELARQRQGSFEAQDAMAEVLFFAAVAADSAQSRAEILGRLDALAPFGSSEWMMAKLLFPPR